MVNLYLIHMLVEHHPEYSRFLEHVDFVFIPIANPGELLRSHKQVVSSEILFQMDMNILTNSIEAGTRIEDLLDVTAMELI